MSKPTPLSTDRGQAWLTAIRSIRSAIALAQAHDIHEIWVAEGVYPEMITLSSNLALYGGFVGDEASIAQRDWEAHASVIDVSHAINDAPAPNAVILYQVTASRIDGFTITGSAKPNPPLPTSHLEWNIPEANLGGGVFCRELDGSQHDRQLQDPGKRCPFGRRSLLLQRDTRDHRLRHFR